MLESDIRSLLPVFGQGTPDEDGVEYSSYPSVHHGIAAALSDNALLQFEIVCFCDIPIEALSMEVVKELRTLLFYQTAAEAFIFGHLKFFNPELPADHDENYYMEREWRVAGKVRFSLADLQRVFVSSEFVNQLRRDLPELANRVLTLSP